MTPDDTAAARAPAAGALAFRPQPTPSVTKALAATLPPRVTLRGARSVGAAWQTWVHYSGQQTFVGRLSRQAAAVAADIVLTWQQHCLTPKTAQKAAQRTLNLPAAGYSSDAALMAQLHRVRTVGQMRQLLEGMLLPDAEPSQPAAAAAAAAAAQLDSPQLSGESSGAQSEGSGSTHSMPMQRGRSATAGTAAAATAAAAAQCRLRHRRKQPSPARSLAPDEDMSVEQEEEPLPAKRLRLSSRRWADDWDS
ncbi:hypothetical protein C2E21_2508 [Chlorella sorokiniana]|uniref:Uncharacterized protein n=1 Tax=Chlorella sorokiniana TaxID=3076 RepID=A0A2P6TYR4_CHLSO|nr:hypothetical protein C2E21_2508 [Chlorella sorokiniana]|eukprot:PRW59207.1 hypothetical protein C2E21_2508 [Chlorella sorokiniana]